MRVLLNPYQRLFLVSTLLMMLSISPLKASAESSENKGQCLAEIDCPDQVDKTPAQSDLDQQRRTDGQYSSSQPHKLEAIVVEHHGEPVTRLPLGTGLSGKTLSTSAGSAGDPLRTIQSMPGMAFTDDSEPLPAVRGSGPGDNHFQVDSIPTDYLFHAGGLISVFNPDLVKSFAVYPSAYGPEFSGFNGGAFDVELRDPENDRFHTSLDISFLQAGLLLEGPVTADQSFYLAGRFSYLDQFMDDQEPDEGVALIQFPKYQDYQAKYVWNLSDNTRARFVANGANEDVALDLDEDAEDVATDPILIGRLQLSSSMAQQGIILDSQLSEKSSLRSTFAHINNDESFKLGGAGTVDIKSETWLSKAELGYRFTDSHELTVGAKLTQESFDVALDFNAPRCTEFEVDCTFTQAERIATTIDDSYTTGQVYIKDDWFVSDRLTLYPGLVVQTENRLNKTKIEPRLAMEYELADDLFLTASAGVYHQLPDIDETNAELGNPDLGYINSTQFLLGLQKSLYLDWEFKTELYYKKLNHLVTGDDTLNYANRGEGRTVGIDTLIRKNLSDRLSGWLAVSLSDSTRNNKATGQQFDFEYDQPVNASLVASYKLSDKWTIGAKLAFHSGALYTPVLGATADDEIEGLYNPIYGALNSERFPSYQRLDLRVDRTVKKSNGRRYSAYLDIMNVLNHTNVSYYDYNADYSEREQGEQTSFFPALGFKAEF